MIPLKTPESILVSHHFGRIPAEWKAAMEAFYKDFASCLQGMLFVLCLWPMNGEFHIYNQL